MRCHRCPQMGAIEPLTAKTPSGHVVQLTKQEEIAAAKKALKQQVAEESVKAVAYQKEIVKAGIGAVGTAIGFALAGFILAEVLGVSPMRR